MPQFRSARIVLSQIFEVRMDGGDTYEVPNHVWGRDFQVGVTHADHNPQLG